MVAAMTDSLPAPQQTGTDPIDDTFVQQFMKVWQVAWNSHDPERVIAWMAPDCVYDDAAWPKTMRNHDDVREFLRHIWAAVPDLTFYQATPCRSPGENKASYYWKVRGTMTGPLSPPGYAPIDGIVDFDGFDYHEYRDGKIIRLRIIFNMMDLGQQVGAVPLPGSMLEKPVVWLQRLKARGMRSKNKRA